MDAHWILDGDTPRKVSWDDYVKWAARSFDETRRIAKTKVGDAEVSTVFLSVDHAFGSGQPVLFETMIFDGPHGDSQWRYHTKAEAEAGHAQIVAALQEGRDPNELSL
jgi:hypothetical protein